MKYATETGSDVMTCIPSFVKFVSGIHEFIGERGGVAQADSTVTSYVYFYFLRAGD
jgi:hypothetical protein